MVSEAFMDSSAIREEREVLDHQRIRIEEILANKIVSPEMARDLRLRLDYISQRMVDLRLTPQVIEETHSGMFG
jgi:hypothetical protein